MAAAQRPMDEPPAYDVYLSYNPRDRDAVREFEALLLEAGLSVWRDESGLEPGDHWQSELASALSQAGFVAVCVGPTGLARGQLGEIEVADARAASDPDFRFAAVLLPGVPEGFSSTALPPQLASRQWVDLRAGIDEA